MLLVACLYNLEYVTASFRGWWWRFSSTSLGWKAFLYLAPDCPSSSATQFTQLKSARFVVSLTWVLLRLMSFIDVIYYCHSLGLLQTFQNWCLCPSPELCLYSTRQERWDPHLWLSAQAAGANCSLVAISDSPWLRGRASWRQIEGGWDFLVFQKCKSCDLKLFGWLSVSCVWLLIS